MLDADTKINADDMCLTHGRKCRRVPSIPTKGVLRVLGGGSPCTDWSPFGCQQTADGPTMVYFLMMMKIALQSRPDILIHENVIQFPFELLQSILGPVYDGHSVLLTPTELGFPVQRKRRYSVMYLKKRVECVKSLPTLMEVCFVKYTDFGVTLNDFLLAKNLTRRCDDAIFMNKNHRKRKRGYQVRVPDATAIDLNQNPNKRCRCGKQHFPSFTRSCQRWCSTTAE